jgi:hypothetical protein
VKLLLQLLSLKTKRSKRSSTSGEKQAHRGVKIFIIAIAWDMLLDTP